MLRHTFLSLLMGAMLALPALAEGPGYHLERLQRQALTVLELLPPPAPAGSELSASVQEQLAGSPWSRQMVSDDVRQVVETTRSLDESLSKEATADGLQQARSQLESLGRRLRVSSSALTLAPAGRTAMDLLLLDLEEAAQSMAEARDQVLAEQRGRRGGVRSVSVGVGFGGWGGWGMGVPYGWGGYYPYGYGAGPGPYLPAYPGFMPGPPGACW